MVKRVVISPGITHFAQNLLVDWINKKLPLNERYTSFIRVGEIAMKIAEDKATKKEIKLIKMKWKVLDELKKIHLEIISDEERLKATRLGEFGYFPDGVYGGENPLEYKDMLRNRILRNKKQRELLSIELSKLIYSAFSGTQIIEEKLKRVLDKAFGIYKEREKIWK